MATSSYFSHYARSPRSFGMPLLAAWPTGYSVSPARGVSRHRAAFGPSNCAAAGNATCPFFTSVCPSLARGLGWSSELPDLTRDGHEGPALAF